MNKKLLFFAAAIAFVFGQSAAEAQLIVHEGFVYPDGSTLGGANGGLGFSAGWVSTNGTGPELSVNGTESISVGNLETSGGFIFRVNRTNFTTLSRTLDASSVSSLTGDGTTVWGSFVYRDGNGDGFNADSSLSLASVPAALANNHVLSAEGVGVGLSIGEDGIDTGGIFYGRITDPAIPPTNPTFGPTTLTDAEVLDATSLFVFSVEWNPDGTDDVLTFYSVTDPSAPLPVAFSTSTFDYSSVEQASLNTLNIVEAQTGEFDEIRLGTTLESVLPTSGITVVLGDANCDGMVDFLDIAPFISLLSNSEFKAQADIDTDGEVTFLDIAPFIQILTDQ